MALPECSRRLLFLRMKLDGNVAATEEPSLILVIFGGTRRRVQLVAVYIVKLAESEAFCAANTLHPGCVAPSCRYLRGAEVAHAHA